MPYKISLGQWGSVFAVPSSVVDNHIKIASEAQLKVLLYILRHSDTELTDSLLSQELRLSVDEVHSAVSFWTERGLVSDSNGTLAPSDTVEPATATVSDSPATPTVQPKTEVSENTSQKHTTVSRAHRPDSAFVAKLLREDAYLSGLLEEAQLMLKKPLSSGDTAVLVMLYSSFGLPCEVIAMLINYLSSVGSANMRAIERYGIRWADEGILTTTQAEHEIERLQSASKAWSRISSLFGIKSIGKPTKSQLDHADRWINTWGFSDEMLTEAYERCVDTKGEYNIRYINAILQKWQDKSIKSLDTLRTAESASKRKKKPNSGSSAKGSVFSVENASFDVNEYENHSLFDD